MYYLEYVWLMFVCMCICVYVHMCTIAFMCICVSVMYVCVSMCIFATVPHVNEGHKITCMNSYLPPCCF